MDFGQYTTLTRQSGLSREMQAIANNIANASTTGFRKEGLIFSEFVQAMDNAPSLSMANGSVRQTSFAQGALVETGSNLDLAIEGDGFFLLGTPDGPRLSRAGAFSPNEFGELVNPDGYQLLDAGQTPVFVPPDISAISIASDGTLSVNGDPQTQLGIFQAAEGTTLTREGGVLFSAEGEFEPVLGAKIMQGFLESSNVNPVGEISRMIEVQRAYELGQSFLDAEDERLRGLMQTLSR